MKRNENTAVFIVAKGAKIERKSTEEKEVKIEMKST